MIQFKMIELEMIGNALKQGNFLNQKNKKQTKNLLY